MRAILSFRNKELLLLRTSELREVPTSTIKDKVNNKEENIEILVNIRGSRKPVLSEVEFRCLFFLNSVRGEIGNILFLT